MVYNGREGGRKMTETSFQKPGWLFVNIHKQTFERLGAVQVFPQDKGALYMRHSPRAHFQSDEVHLVIAAFS